VTGADEAMLDICRRHAVAAMRLLLLSQRVAEESLLPKAAAPAADANRAGDGCARRSRPDAARRRKAGRPHRPARRPDTVFVNLPRTLVRCRELRGKSQAEVARKAGVGKSQLSKYESGKELPKLESLERVLVALGFGSLDFFYALHLMDHEVDRPAQNDRSEDVAAAFKHLMSHLVDLHRQVVLETSRRGETPGEEG
jgi:transcriptional regulator with XRE-family HTH domain